MTLKVWPVVIFAVQLKAKLLREVRPIVSFLSLLYVIHVYNVSNPSYIITDQQETTMKQRSYMTASPVRRHIVQMAMSVIV